MPCSTMQMSPWAWNTSSGGAAPVDHDGDPRRDTLSLPKVCGFLRHRRATPNRAARTGQGHADADCPAGQAPAGAAAPFLDGITVLADTSERLHVDLNGTQPLRPPSVR